MTDRDPSGPAHPTGAAGPAGAAPGSTRAEPIPGVAGTDEEVAVQNPDVGHDTTDSSVGGVPTSGQEGSPTDVTPSAEELGRLVDATEAAAASADASAASFTDGTDGAAAPADSELDRARAELAERTADVQRVSAEYANYRRRVDRDRETTVSGAKAQVATELLTVLDDVDRAESHGDLTGPFKVVADRLRESLQRAGLSSFGVVGDLFDPTLHEAVAQETSPEVSGPTVTTVMRRGYRFADRVLRPAMVAVTDTDGSGGPTGSADQVSAGSDRPQH